MIVFPTSHTSGTSRRFQGKFGELAWLAKVLELTPARPQKKRKTLGVRVEGKIGRISNKGH